MLASGTTFSPTTSMRMPAQPFFDTLAADTTLSSNASIFMPFTSSLTFQPISFLAVLVDARHRDDLVVQRFDLHRVTFLHGRSALFRRARRRGDLLVQHLDAHAGSAHLRRARRRHDLVVQRFDLHRVTSLHGRSAHLRRAHCRDDLVGQHLDAHAGSGPLRGARRRHDLVVQRFDLHRVHLAQPIFVEPVAGTTLSVNTSIFIRSHLRSPGRRGRGRRRPPARR